MTASVSPAHRFSARNPCPICEGGHHLPTGQGIRCFGFLSSDSRYAHCTREEYAGALALEDDAETYAHRLDGPCGCGLTHGEKVSFQAPPVGKQSKNGHAPPRRVVQERRWRITTDPRTGDPVEHVRLDYDDGSKAVWWERGGQKNLGGIEFKSLPLYGHRRPAARDVIVVEGEKACDALAGILSPEHETNVLGTVLGAPRLPNDQVLAELVKEGYEKIYLWPDNDKPGATLMQRLGDRLIALGRKSETIHMIDWVSGHGIAGADAADFVAGGGSADDLMSPESPHFRFAAPKERVAAENNVAVNSRPNGTGASPSGPDSPRSKIFTAATLQTKTFDPLPFAVPEILSQGAALLCGPPKIGKSRLALQLACAVAYGGVALSHTEVAKGGVLVLALEDGERRLHARLEALLSDETDPWPEELALATEWPTLDQGGAEELDAYLTEHPATRLVIVDVLQMIRPPTSGQQNAYAADYAAMRTLKSIADRHDATVLVVHHTRKNMDANDPLDLVNGTNGLAGAVDTVLILQREPNGADATLYLRGRDVEEAQFTLAYDRERGAWNVAGEARTRLLSETREKIIAALEQAWPKTMAPKEIADATGLDENVVHQRLHHLEAAGQIRRERRGQYTLIGPPWQRAPGPDALSSHTPHKDRKDRKDGENSASPREFSDTPILTFPRTPRKDRQDGEPVPDDSTARKDGRKDENPHDGADASPDLTNLTMLTPPGAVPHAGSGTPHEEIVL